MSSIRLSMPDYLPLRNPPCGGFLRNNSKQEYYLTSTVLSVFELKLNTDLNHSPMRVKNEAFSS